MNNKLAQLCFSAKKGPIYDSAWAPSGNQFVVVFGFMPAKACIFNLKCDSIFEFGPTPKNLCYFNPHVSSTMCSGRIRYSFLFFGKCLSHSKTRMIFDITSSPSTSLRILKYSVEFLLGSPKT